MSVHLPSVHTAPFAVDPLAPWQRAPQRGQVAMRLRRRPDERTRSTRRGDVKRLRSCGDPHDHVRPVAGAIEWGVDAESVCASYDMSLRIALLRTGRGAARARGHARAAAVGI